MHYVLEATYLSDYRIKVRFENGQVKVVDLGPHLEGHIFEPLKNIKYFQRLSINQDIDTVTWPNHADFSPDFLYEIAKEISEQPASKEIREGG